MKVISMLFKLYLINFMQLIMKIDLIHGLRWSWCGYCPLPRLSNFDIWRNLCMSVVAPKSGFWYLERKLV